MPASFTPRTMCRLWIFLCAIVLAACSSNPRYARPPADLPFRLLNADGGDFAVYALGLVGTPYRFGGTDPTAGFDCSGLISFVLLRVADAHVPRRSVELSRIGRALDRRELKNGDLVFFDTANSGVSHVGLYVGQGRFVHAPSEGALVRIDQLDASYWRARYRGARRLTLQ